MESLKIRIETQCQTFGTNNIEVNVPVKEEILADDLEVYLKEVTNTLLTSIKEKFNK